MRLTRILIVLLLFLALPTLVSGRVLQNHTLSERVLNAQPLDVRQATVNGHSNDKQGVADRLQLIVELDAPSVVAWQLEEGRAIDIRSSNANTYRQQLFAEQYRLWAEVVKVAECGKPLCDSAEIGYTYQTIFNGMSLTVSPSDYPALTQLDGIKRIYFAETYEPQLDASLDLIGATDMWASVGGQDMAGDGIKVAVIDSGINSDHNMFAGDDFTMPPGYPLGYCVTDDPTFCNGKIITARWYGENGDVPPDSDPLEQPTPEDYSGHGSHVAGIAAGNDDILKGVAPRAHLMVYKACWLGASCPAAGLLMALEDAVIDGADIINNSWGGGAGGNPDTSPFKTAIDNAVAAGAVVVFAAGNDGPDEQTISCPGCVESAITVGNSTTNRVQGNRLDVTAPAPVPPELVNLPTIAGIEFPIFTDIANPILYSGTVDANNVNGCNSWPANAFFQAVALIPRGDCAFEVKIDNAADAGAVAVVIINNQLGAPEMMSVGMTTIPAVMISQSDGNALITWASDNGDAAIFIEADTERFTRDEWEDWVWRTSGRGPNGDPTVLKPDLVAPGTLILSANAPSWPDYQYRTGTSMAAPHVAGAAALLRQAQPTWTVQQIKAGLMATSQRDGILQENGAIAANPFDMGAGRLDLSRLSRMAATFDQPSYANPICAGICEWHNALTSVVDYQENWQLSSVAPAGMEISAPQVLGTQAFGSADFTITIDVSSLPPYQWYFAHVGYVPLFTNDIHWMPLAVYAVPEETVLFEKSAETAINADDTIHYQLTIRNTDAMTRTYRITDTLPTNVAYVNGSATGGLTYDAIDHTLTATIDVPPTFQLKERDLGGYLPLGDFGIEPEACAGLCDDDWFDVQGLDFFFMGEYHTSLQWNTNGFVTLGTPSGNANTPQQMPDPDFPNHVIAPLWTDLDLQGDDSDPAGGGELYAAQVSDGATTWTVFEWKDAEHWMVPAVKHTFQLWIQNGTDQLWFAYGDQQNLGVLPVAVGVEGSDGILGLTTYYKNDVDPPAGTPPSSDNELLLTYFGGVQLSFEGDFITGDVALNVAVANDGSRTYAASAQTIIGRDNLFLPLIRNQ